MPYVYDKLFSNNNKSIFPKSEKTIEDLESSITNPIQKKKNEKRKKIETNQIGPDIAVSVGEFFQRPKDEINILENNTSSFQLTFNDTLGQRSGATTVISRERQAALQNQQAACNVFADSVRFYPNMLRTRFSGWGALCPGAPHQPCLKGGSLWACSIVPVQV